MTSDKNTDGDLDFLKQQMDAATPAPDAARRAENMGLAMENFDRAQGSSTEPRHSKDRPKPGLLAGVWTMLTTRSTAALLGSTIVATGLVVMIGPFGQPEPITSRFAPSEADVTTTGPQQSTEELLAQDAPILVEPAPAPIDRTEEAAGVGGILATPVPEAEAPEEPLLQPSYVPLEPPVLVPSDPDGVFLDGDFGTGTLGEDEQPPGALPPAVNGVEMDPSEIPAPVPEAPRQQPFPGVALSGSAEMGIIGGSEEFFQDTDIEFALSGSAEERGGAEIAGEQTGRIQEAGRDNSVFIEGDFGTLTLGDTDGPLDRVRAEPDREAFPEAEPSELQVTLETPVSTFSIDVDTASYALLRSNLNRGQLPRPEAVRIEEMVNYFSYDYPAPGPEAEAPFQPSFTVFETPWNPDTQLVHIALQGEMPVERPDLNLVFLIDVSGSMDDPAKLPLLIQSFRLMLGELAPDDQVAIVTYAGHTGVALEPTPASERATIEAALTDLRAGGSTNGQGGLEAAYDLAEQMTDDGEVSRVILATDGDFNVGLSDPSRLADYIAQQRESGTYLSVLGFGRGNLQDATMQALAQNGNGTAAYIDTLHEAQRVLVDQLSGALFPIADDVKVQVEFNPARVAEYRLIGYETRALAREDFNDDAVDAGELGAGHRVTAIYEITPVGSPAIRTDPLRYGDVEALPVQAEALSEEIGFLRLRWKEPGEDVSQLMDFPVTETVAPSTEALFATAIAGFGQLLQGSAFLGAWGYDDAIDLANANRGADPFGLRREAVQLMRLADSLDSQ